ncbi:hypothetical protein [Streptomyces sp. NPDC051567]|uniref:SCO4983 family protein n=1 Tax=Streptomyces sp. NPDC051567 TaxID=3365660 RepID=UPI0037A51412
MYEPIRAQQVAHRTVGDDRTTDYPHRSRGEALDVQLAGHLTALLAVTDELGLDESAERIAAQVARLRGDRPVHARRVRSGDAVTLHRRAHDLAARALVVAASRADTAAAILTAERMDAHAAAVGTLDPAGTRPPSLRAGETP